MKRAERQNLSPHARKAKLIEIDACLAIRPMDVQHDVSPVDRDAVGVTGHFAPGIPTVDRVAAPFERIRLRGLSAADLLECIRCR